MRAGRRRPSSSGGGERERAPAPERQPSGGSSGGGAYRPTGGGGGGGGGALPPNLFGGMIPRGLRTPLMILLLILLCLFYVVPNFFGGRDQGSQQQAPVATEAAPAETEAPLQAPASLPTPRPTATRPASAPAAPSSSSGKNWTVMLYQDADDKILEQDIYFDLNEAERVGSSENVKIVTQIDRFRTGFQGDGDWTSTRRYLVSQDQDLSRIRSEEVDDLGEANMADGQTLVDFVTWAAKTYPADHYVLILSDHGMGWPGGWSDPTARRSGGAGSPLESALDDHLYLNELDQALQSIQQEAGLDRLELIGMDACLMGHIEVLSALQPYANYAVVSQETEPSLGWAYASFLQALVDNPGMSGADLAGAIVNSYIVDDQRIVDDQARQEFAGRGSPLDSLFGSFGAPTASDVTRQLERDITLTAVDLQAVPQLMDQVNALAFTLQQANQRQVAKARSYAQSFTNIFGDKTPSPYLDLGNFIDLLAQEGGSRDVASAGQAVQAALQDVVIAEKHGQNKPGATGISIYFPNSSLYGSPVAGPESYTAIADRFAAGSLWDDFLAFHYTGRGFKRSDTAAVAPSRAETIEAPGAGQIQVSALTLSSKTAAPGQPVTLSADIQGENIGYIQLFVAYYDQASRSLYVADQDFLESSETREVDGVYYPDWGQGAFTLEFDWEPIVFGLSDGSRTVPVLLTPQSYGATPEDAVYTVEGIYTFADGGETRPARLYLRDGSLRQVFGFTGEGEAQAPREIIPQPGDTFTILEKWMDLDANGNVSQVVSQEGETLTFGDSMFTWEELDAAAGNYLVGFIVSDLDGQSEEVFEQVQVK